MSKLDQIKALREAKASNTSSRGSPTRPCKPGISREVIGSNAGNPLTEQGEPSPRETKRGRPRIGEVRDKPWIAAGMSRRTWYRRKAEAKWCAGK